MIGLSNPDSSANQSASKRSSRSAKKNKADNDLEETVDVESMTNKVVETQDKGDKPDLEVRALCACVICVRLNLIEYICDFHRECLSWTAWSSSSEESWRWCWSRTTTTSVKMP